MEPSIEDRLRRLTPKAGTIDRDSLLFAAGRASAQPNRFWIGLSAVLAVTQALTVAYFYGSPPPATAPIAEVGRKVKPTVAREPADALRLESSSDPTNFQVRLLIDEDLSFLDRDDVMNEDQMIPPAPPLYASSTALDDFFDEIFAANSRPE